jgi:murein DD-endopeptidase MepM/ murein hydrolase activator NlpD
MTSRGKAFPFFALAISTLIVVGATVPALPAEAASEPPFVLEFPQDPQPTVFSSTFGASRSSGRAHQGNDLMAPKLTHVYAAAAGIVTVIDTHGSAGRYVEIQHRAGWSTRYLHLNNDDPGTDNGRADWSLTLVPGLGVGSHVEAGQHIGFVGDSGNAESTGSHTHFELAHEGGEVDPYPVLKDAYARAIALRAAATRGSMRFGDAKMT